MSYRTPESLIRQIMAESHAPALKIPEPDRVADALKALSDNGITATKKDDNTIAVDPADTEKAINIMNNSFFHGKTQASPKIVSSNSIEAPELPMDEHEPKAEPHPPEGGMKLGEALGDENSNHLDKEDGPEERTQDIQPVEGEVGGVNIQLNKRSIVNRMENQLKKIDEENLESDPEFDAMFEEATAEDIRALDEVSKQSMRNYLAKNDMSVETMDRHTKENNGMISRKHLKKYIARDAGRIKAVSKLHGNAKVPATEDFKSPAVALVRRLAEQVLLDEAKGQRKVGEVHSDCGNHTAKIYKDKEWGEHVVKFHINGKHHEPSDYHTDDHHDAFGTAKQELNRMTKLNGALKEATEEAIAEIMEDYDQLDELSKATLSSYVKKADKSAEAHSDAHAGFSKIKGGSKAAYSHLKKSVNRNNRVGQALAKMSKKPADKDGFVNLDIDDHHAVNHADGAHVGNGYKARIKANEETESKKNSEELSEVSAGLLSRYVVKAKKDSDAHRDAGKQFAKMSRQGANTGSAATKSLYKSADRLDGIGRAMSKIKGSEHIDAGGYAYKSKVKATNEEVELLDEKASVKVGTYFTAGGVSLHLHKHPENDHHVLISDGKVMKSFNDTSENVHAELSRYFKGKLHEASVGLTRTYIGGGKKKNDGSISEKKKTTTTRRKNKLKEEAEDLNEISVNLAARYVRKSIDAQKSMKGSSDNKKRGNREDGELRAMGKIEKGINGTNNKSVKTRVAATMEGKNTLGGILEEAKRGRGRPKKKRDMQGNVIDDDATNQ